MTGVRNGVLVRKILAGTGWEVVATVPVNETWLIKAVHWQSLGTVLTAVQLLVGHVDAGIQFRLPELELEPGATGYQSVWTAANAGDAISALANAFPVHLAIAGAALPGSTSF